MDNCLKVTVITQLEFELAYFELAVKVVCHLNGDFSISYVMINKLSFQISTETYDQSDSMFDWMDFMAYQHLLVI